MQPSFFHSSCSIVHCDSSKQFLVLRFFAASRDSWIAPSYRNFPTKSTHSMKGIPLLPESCFSTRGTCFLWLFKLFFLSLFFRCSAARLLLAFALADVSLLLYFFGAAVVLLSLFFLLLVVSCNGTECLSTWRSPHVHLSVLQQVNGCVQHSCSNQSIRSPLAAEAPGRYHVCMWKTSWFQRRLQAEKSGENVLIFHCTRQTCEPKLSAQAVWFKPFSPEMK